MPDPISTAITRRRVLVACLITGTLLLCGLVAFLGLRWS